LVTTLCLNFQAQNESCEQLGTWNPGKVKLKIKGDHTSAKEILINRPLAIEYKYTLGS